MEEDFSTIIIKVEPEDDYENNPEHPIPTSEDAEKVVESLLHDAECEEMNLDRAGLRNIIAGIEGVDDLNISELEDDLDISEMEAADLKMEIQDDIDLIERDEYRNSTGGDIENELKMEIQDDIEMIERNEFDDSDLDEIANGLGAEVTDINESGIVELVEKDVLQLTRNKPETKTKSKEVENTVQVSKGMHVQQRDNGGDNNNGVASTSNGVLCQEHCKSIRNIIILLCAV
ncbi:probable inactive protein kinase DDB_G0270444 [Ruditapes philippinarum]|uniref:probable inactive protein kinase DDB_G0270444 n=1 Tax=Ruditapes philippinarum TaxID=129788 RepID=UPI00295A6C0B|nr:probable inactive protein kinase DDB_G0270444 [Ruditapes philippinarum]